MQLKRLRIKNFRGLEQVSMRVNTPAAVIVGPNATGKTSILQALRLFKAILAPSYTGEPNETLQNIGALSPHIQQVNFANLAGDPTQPIEIESEFQLSTSEIEYLRSSTAQLARLGVEAELGRPPGESELQLVQFLSSTAGQERLRSAADIFTKELASFSESSSISSTLTIDGNRGIIQGTNGLAHMLITQLSRAPKRQSGFISFFPADRALPSGEANVQLGTIDIQQQVQSHIAYPELKHQRLKTYIINATLEGESSRTQLSEDFAEIFDRLLPGKELAGVTVLPHGHLTVQIRERASGATYDIDNMSSGEKGLLLTFFLARRQMKKGGILLIDEPELHLNPAVCKRILPFFLESVIIPVQLQAIICTHSPEILGAAYERPDCTLFHLKSRRDLSPVYQQDKNEVFEALKRLGSTASDVLFSKGNLFVEGPHDADLLQLGFASRITGLAVRPLGGRQEVEKEIRALQEGEKKSELDGLQCFIFDKDRQPSEFRSSNRVRVGQWDRYCFENYLLDSDAIYEAAKELRASTEISRGTLDALIRETALKQLPEIAAQTAYRALEPENAGLRSKELSLAADMPKLANLLAERLGRISQQLLNFDKTSWMQKFAKDSDLKRQELTTIWERSWLKECDGKRVVESLYKDFKLQGSVLEFKRRIVSHMERNKSDNWKVVDSLLSQVLGQQGIS